MSNQTIATLPFDLTDPLALKRFLSELVNNLDIVLGYKGGDRYATSKQLQNEASNLSQTVLQIQSSLKQLQELSDSLEDQQERIEDLQLAVEELQMLLKTDSLGSAFHDFNSTSWSTLVGKGEFTAIGSEITNAPFTVDADTNYTVLVDSTKTSTAVWQEILVNSSDKYVRTSVSNNWIHLAKVL